MPSAAERIAALEAVCRVKCAEVDALGEKVDELEKLVDRLTQNERRRLGLWSPAITTAINAVILAVIAWAWAHFRGAQ